MYTFLVPSKFNMSHLCCAYNSKSLIILVILFFIILNSPSANGQSTSPNSDFEEGNFSGWSGEIGTRNRISGEVNWQRWGGGITYGRHTIIRENFIDRYTCGQLPSIPPNGGNFVARLGNNINGAQAERLIYPITITEDNSLFLYRYAVVFENPDHEEFEQPYFTLEITDENGDIVDPNCGYFNVVSSDGLSGFQTCNIYLDDDNDPRDNDRDTIIEWKQWTTVAVDLTSYIGQELNMVFTNADCARGGHWAYSYMEVVTDKIELQMHICEGDAVGTVSAPDGFSSYIWNTGATTQSITINNPTPGEEYYCDMYSTPDCSIRLSTTIQIDSLHLAVHDTAICEGEQVVLSAIGATQIRWNTGETTETITVSPNSTTIYSVTGTTEQGCTAEADLQVTVNPSPRLTVSGPTEICRGESTLLTVSGADLYEWNELNEFTSSITISPEETGNYEVTGTNLNGCESSISTEVLVKPIPEIHLLDSTSFCTEEAIIESGNTSADTYLWSTGETTTAILVNETGNYSLTVTDNACSASKQTHIVVSDNIEINLGPDTAFCRGNSLTLTPGSGYHSYLWNTGETSQVIRASESGRYSVTVSDGTCEANDEIAISIIEPISPNFTLVSDTNEICENNPVNIRALNIENAGSNPTYLWTINGVNISSTSDSITLTDLDETSTVSLAITNNDECVLPSTAIESLTIEVNEYLTPQLNLDIYPYSACEKTPISINASFQNGGNNPSIHWYINDELIDNTNSFFSSDTLSAYTEIRVQMVSNAECSIPLVAEDKFIVSPNPDPVINLEEHICLESEETPITIEELNNTGGSFQFISAPGVDENEYPALFDPMAAGEGLHEISVIWINSYGCTAETSTNINVHNIGPPEVDRYKEDIIGVRPYKNFIAQGDGTIYWYDDQKVRLFQNETLNPDTSCIAPPCITTYFVNQVLEPYGCESEYVEVTYYMSQCVVPAPVTQDISICDYDDLPTITAQLGTNWPSGTESGISSLAWFSSKSNTDNPVFATSIPATGYSPTEQSYFVRQYNNDHDCYSAPREVKLYINSATQPAPIERSICDGSPIPTFIVPTSNLIKWYESEISTNSLATGNTFTPSSINQLPVFFTQSQNGCESNKVPARLRVYPIPASPYLEPQKVCEGGEYSLETNELTDQYKIEWRNMNNDLLSNNNKLKIERMWLSLQDSTFFKARVIDLSSPLNCASEYNQTYFHLVANPEKPNIIGPDKLCFGNEYDSLIATYSEPTNRIEWYSENDELLHEGFSYYPIIDKPGTYKYKAIAYNYECVSPPEIHKIIVQPVPNPVIGGPYGVCVNTSTRFYVINPRNDITYRWGSTENNIVLNNVDNYNRLIDVRFIVQGIEELYVTEITTFGCAGSDTLEIKVANPPKPDFNFDVSFWDESVTFSNTSEETVIEDENFYLELESDFYWNYGKRKSDTTFQSFEDKYIDTTVKYIFGTYNVNLMAINEFGCVADTTKLVPIEAQYALYLPNSVCPSHPSFQISVFHPRGFGLVEYRLWIYDKWGNLIWFTDKLRYNAPMEFWDCKYNGNLVQQGFYIWKAEAKFKNGYWWQGQRAKNGEISNMGEIFVFY